MKFHALFLLATIMCLSSQMRAVERVYYIAADELVWGFAATACIYKELEAHVTDSHGQALALNPTDTTFMNEKGVLFVVAPNAQEPLARLDDLFPAGAYV